MLQMVSIFWQTLTLKLRTDSCSYQVLKFLIKLSQLFAVNYLIKNIITKYFQKSTCLFGASQNAAQCFLFTFLSYEKYLKI